MAQRVITSLVDDIDASTADETVTFGLDGVTYEIDLSTAHAAELRDAFATWVGHGRRVGGKSSAARSRRSPASGGVSPDVVRAWAKENGHVVSERGRISAAVREAYAAAH